MSGLVERLRENIARVTSRGRDLPWQMQDGCSYRRIGRRHGGDGDVLAATTQRSDGHLDLTMPGDQLEALVEIMNDQLDLLSHIETLELDLAAAISEATKQAREAGEAKGRLETSEMAGVVEGWQRRCERFEAALKRCATIVERYNRRQNEKLDDIPIIVRQALEQSQ